MYYCSYFTYLDVICLMLLVKASYCLRYVNSSPVEYLGVFIHATTWPLNALQLLPYPFDEHMLVVIKLISRRSLDRSMWLPSFRNVAFAEISLRSSGSLLRSLRSY
jgi:hypothetical protein